MRFFFKKGFHCHMGIHTKQAHFQVISVAHLSFDSHFKTELLWVKLFLRTQSLIT